MPNGIQLQTWGSVMSLIQRDNTEPTNILAGVQQAMTNGMTLSSIPCGFL